MNDTASDTTRTATRPLMEAMFLPGAENNPQPGERSADMGYARN